MKKKLTIILCTALLLLCSVVVLCACGTKSAKPSDVLPLLVQESAPEFTTAKEIDFGSGNVILTSRNYLLVTGNNADGATTYANVYNSVSDRNVYTATGEETAINLHATRVYNCELFSVVKEDKVTLYNGNGSAIASSDNINASVNCYADLIVFDNVCYRVAKNKSVSTAFAVNKLKNYPFANISNWTFTENYYYEFDNTATDQKVIVYDKNLEYAGKYTVPGYAVNPTLAVLDDGKIFCQYSIALADDAKKFDYFNAGTKYDLVTEVYTAKKNKLSSVDCDYYIVNVSSLKLVPMDLRKPKFSATAMGYEIADGQLNDAASEIKVLGMDSKGKITAGLTQMFDGMQGIPSYMKSDRFSYDTIDGETVMINGKGKKVGFIGSITNSNNRYLWNGEAVYDYNLNEVVDLQKENMTVFGMTDELVFLRKVNALTGDFSYYVYDGELKSVLSESDVARGDTLTVNGQFYRISSGALHNYYSADGTKLVTSDCVLNVVISDGETSVTILSGINDGIRRYYRFA